MRTDHQLAGRPRASSGSRARCRAVLVAVALVVGLSACGDDDDDDGSPASAGDAATLPGTSWTLTSVSIDGDDVAAVGSPTLEFAADGTTLTGTTGCNQFSGTYEESGSDVTIALGPITRAACGDPAGTAQETAIVAQLPEVASFTADGQLVLQDADGATLLTYDAARSELVGTSWTATGVNNGRGGVESTAATASVTAEFGRDGALSGFAGCNTFTAAYTLSGGDGISITGIATTQQACEDESTTLEDQYLAALQAVASFTMSGDTLTLRDATGSTQVTYAPAG